MSGKIPFTEEIHLEGANDSMECTVNSYLDYIDSEPVSGRNFTIKAVAILDAEVANKHPVDYISSLESDGTFQAKTKNITYTDIVSSSSEEVTISDAIEAGKSDYEISEIVKADGDVYITNIDTMNDRMLVEGILKAGFLYTAESNPGAVNFVSEEFPFTHYIELKNSTQDMIRDISVNLGELTYTTAKNLEDQTKFIEFTAKFNVDAKIYDKVDKNIMVDGYSTESEIEIESASVYLSTYKDISSSTVKYENSFDVSSGTVKDIYTVSVIPKVSEKKVSENKYVVDGFLDVNLLYLNGDVNRIDRAFASMPFTASLDASEGDSVSSLSSEVRVNKCSAARKGNSAVSLSCDINLSLKNKQSDKITVISNITEAGKIDRNKIPSLVFRVVQPGETVWDIAKNYNVSINYLKELNDISFDDTLAPGTKIVIARKV
jgi:hypothetical protein